MAIQYPTINFVGIELYKKGISKVLIKLYLYRIKNVKIIYKDAYKIISNIKKHSVYGIHILFPDPWTKCKHFKRRLINIDFISKSYSILMKGGFIHTSTDVKEYARSILYYFYCRKFLFKHIKIFKKSMINKKTKFQKKNTLKKIL